MTFLSTLIYRTLVRYVHAKTKYYYLVAGILYFMRLILIKTIDPQNCKMEVHGKMLRMPLSHNLPLYAARFPFYDTLVGRVSAFIERRHGELVYIDVGANIGDTITAAWQSEKDICLGIEPDDIYFKYLEKNTDNIPGVKRIQTICSSKDGISKQMTLRERGTAKLVNNQSIASVEKRLDTILSQDAPEFRGVNFIKIDTDGYDFEVLKGATRIIKMNQPAVLFECQPACDPTKYINDVISTLKEFKRAGYTKAIFYDNFGCLFSIYNLKEVSRVKFPLMYQFMSRFYYFDILIMKAPDIDEFMERDFLYFAHALPNEVFKSVVFNAIHNE